MTSGMMSSWQRLAGRMWRNTARTCNQVTFLLILQSLGSLLLGPNRASIQLKTSAGCSLSAWEAGKAFLIHSTDGQRAYRLVGGR